MVGAEAGRAMAVVYFDGRVYWRDAVCFKYPQMFASVDVAHAGLLESFRPDRPIGAGRILGNGLGSAE